MSNHFTITLADARNLLSRFTPPGQFEANLNMALTLIHSWTSWRGVRSAVEGLEAHVVAGILTLPAQYRSLVTARTGPAPLTIFEAESEYSPGGSGYQDPGAHMGALIDLGFANVVAEEGDAPALLRRYKVLCTLDHGLAGIARLHQPLVVQDTDLIIPGNLLVLRDALYAVNYGEQGDIQRAQAAEEAARSRLIREYAEDTVGVTRTFDPGAGALGLGPIPPNLP